MNDKPSPQVPRIEDVTGIPDTEQKRLEREWIKERLRFYNERKKYGFGSVGKGVWRSHIEKSRSF